MNARVFVTGIYVIFSEREREKMLRYDVHNLMKYHESNVNHAYNQPNYD